MRYGLSTYMIPDPVFTSLTPGAVFTTVVAPLFAAWHLAAALVGAVGWRNQRQCVERA